MSLNSSWRRAIGAVVIVCASGLPAGAAEPPASPSSSLDAPLFYQVLIGEIELNAGEAGAAYEVILDAARRTKNDLLFRRAADIALRGRAGDQALAASRAWRTANPASLEALRLQLQILLALNRVADAAEPMQSLLELTPDVQRPGVIAAMPRYLERVSDRKQAAALLQDVLKPYAEAPATRTAARVAVGRGWFAAGDGERALALARQAAVDDPSAPGPMLLALDLIPTQPDAEKLVAAQLKQPDIDVGLRLAYVRALTNLQRYAEAIKQLELISQQKPDLAPPYLSLGALYLELHRDAQGEAALLRYVELAQKDSATPSAEPAASDADTDDDDDDEAHAAHDGQEADAQPQAHNNQQGLIQAWLMLAQVAEQRGDFKGAEAWLAKVDDPRRALEVQTRRASILARQGRVDEARELIRRAPERSPDDARAKLVAEAAVLRDIKRWSDAFDVLARANQRFPDNADLLYEQAMMAEKIDRVDEMERLLRKVIELKPGNAQAHNALGYSLADRRVRLPEARQLIQRALELSPGDPFITDSLGWVEYRMGNREEALRLLRQAYQSRPDPEIAAHLGEVLWAYGQQDEARKVWTEAKGRDSANDVLLETLSRLKVGL